MRRFARHAAAGTPGGAAALHASLRGIRRGQLRMAASEERHHQARQGAIIQDGNPLVYGARSSGRTGDVSRGDAVEVVDGAGNNIGWGFYNPDSMYRVRLLPGPMSDDPMQAVRSLIETA